MCVRICADKSVCYIYGTHIAPADAAGHLIHLLPPNDLRVQHLRDPTTMLNQTSDDSCGLTRWAHAKNPHRIHHPSTPLVADLPISSTMSAHRIRTLFAHLPSSSSSFTVRVHAYPRWTCIGAFSTVETNPYFAQQHSTLCRYKNAPPPPPLPPPQARRRPVWCGCDPVHVCVICACVIHSTCASI